MPQTDMMTLTSALPNSLFERKILAPSVVKQGAHGCVRIRPVEDRTTGDREGALNGDRIGRRPTGRVHCSDDLRTRSDETDIDRVAGDPLLGRGAHGKFAQTR